MTKKTSLLLSALLFSVLASGCTVQAICAKREECASDPPGADYQRVCEAKTQGHLNALRANSEEECIRLAAAQEALWACQAQLDCDDFEENDLGGKCDDEIDEFEDAWEDAADGQGFAGFFSGVPVDCSAYD